MKYTKRFMMRISFSLIMIGLAACTGVVAETLPQSSPEEVAPAEVAGEDDLTEGEAVEAAPIKPLAGAVEETEEAGQETEQQLMAGTNIARHEAPLEDIHFDTFNGSSVPLSEASERIILQLRDAIPPIETPKYTDVETADRWLKANDTVIGYVDGDEALAYPAKIMNYHEIVNENINGRPVLISYCPLCNSGIVYDRQLGDQVLEFGNTSALYQSDMVMYDRQTFSYWFQVGGDAIVGDLTGQRLTVLPTQFMTWAAWRETYPDSKVLSRDTGFNRPYERDPFQSLAGYLNRGRFAFPVGEAALDPALPAGERVISLVIADEARAYALEALAGSVVNDEVGGQPVAIIVDEAETGSVFSREVGDQTVTLAWDGSVLKDEETGSTWSAAGEAIEGPLKGRQLELLAARFSYWFAFVAAFPEATAYQP